MDRLDPQRPEMPKNAPEIALDPVFKAQVERLHQLTVYSRWLIVGILWISVAPLSVWGWRYELSLLRSHFTWAALRYGIFFNNLPVLGFSLCVGMTAAVLVWQSRNILMGLPREEQRRLEKQVLRIRASGSSHPLWKWICQP
jgi:hypothetical protein